MYVIYANFWPNNLLHDLPFHVIVDTFCVRRTHDASVAPQKSVSLSSEGAKLAFKDRCYHYFSDFCTHFFGGYLGTGP